MLSALFALVATTAMVISFINLYRSRRDLSRLTRMVDIFKAVHRMRIVVDGIDGFQWSSTLVDIIDAPTPHLIAPMPGALVVITTDPDRGTP